MIGANEYRSSDGYRTSHGIFTHILHRVWTFCALLLAICHNPDTFRPIPPSRTMAANAFQRRRLAFPAFGEAGRIVTPFSYWLVRWPNRRERPVVAAFEHWLLEQAELTRALLARTVPR